MPAPLVAVLKGVWPDGAPFLPQPVPTFSFQLNRDARIRLVVSNPDGAPKDLTGSTVYLMVGHGAWPAPWNVPKAGTIITAAAGIVEWSFVPADTLLLPTYSYSMEFTMTDSGGFSQRLTREGLLTLEPSAVSS